MDVHQGLSLRMYLYQHVYPIINIQKTATYHYQVSIARDTSEIDNPWELGAEAGDGRNR